MKFASLVECRLLGRTPSYECAMQRPIDLKLHYVVDQPKVGE